MNNSQQQYIDIYNNHKELINKHAPEPLNRCREKAFEDFKRLGFPTKKNEKYKYTDITKIFSPDYGLNLNRLYIPVDPYRMFCCNVPNLNTGLFFVVNDIFYGKKTENIQLPEGVIIDSIRNAAQTHPQLIKQYYCQIADTEKDAVTALNTMLAQDGIFIYVPQNTVVSQPLQLINLLRSDVDLMVNRRMLIILEKNSKLQLLSCDHALDHNAFLATQVIETYVAQNAHLELYCMEETHEKNHRVSNLYIRQDADSHVDHNIITLHNGITRNNIHVLLQGQGAECNMSGCVIADKQQHVDNHLFIDHQAMHTGSRQLYKYVLDQDAKGAFVGHVKVNPEAQKTSSEQINQNLCITKKSHMYTQPILEIYADDVKCAHGATVGQLDQDALFYMLQRGIPRKEAETLLKYAFITEVVDRLTLEPLKERLHVLVEKRFRGTPDKCEGCRLAL